MTAHTPGQTVGPFFGMALPYEGGSQLVPPGTPGAVRLHGRVLDGAGEPVPDAMLELWQPDAGGVAPRATGSLRRDGWTFTGWGRAATDPDGRWAFTTLPPGRADGLPFVALAVFARGLLDRLHTRCYLPSDTAGSAAAAADPFLATLPEARRATLLATAEPSGWRFDVRLQGDGETVFLAHRPSGTVE